MAATNSTYPKGGFSCSKASFVVNQTLVFQIMFCGKSPALRVAAKRYAAAHWLFELKESLVEKWVSDQSAKANRV